MKGRIVAPAHHKHVKTGQAAAYNALLQTVESYRSGQTDRAYAEAQKYLSRFGENFDILHLLGTIDHDAGRLDAAWQHWQQALKMVPTHVLLLNKIGALARKLKKEVLAEQFFRQAIAADPGKPEAHFNLGNLLSTRADWLPAIQSYSNAIECQPDFMQAYNNLGIALKEFGRPDEAVKVLDTALAKAPREERLHINKAKALQAMSLGKAAVTHLRAVLDQQGPHFEVLTALADIETAENDYAAAHGHYTAALKLQPNSAVIHNNLANLLQDMGRLDEAMHHYKQAIQIDPDFYQALQNLCNILNGKKDYAQSLRYYERVRQINPASPYLSGMSLNARMHTCTWAQWEEHVAEVCSGLQVGAKVVNPFPPLAFLSDVRLLTRSAQLWVQHQVPQSQVLPPIPFRPRTPGQKIRVGYYSADLYTHATALLMAGVLESHDRQGFEWIAFSFGPAQEDALSQRVRSAFDRFIDVRTYSDRVVAQLSRELGIHIAIDLKGFTQDARTGIFAERAAPVQVNYLGFPGSMGAPYIDYIIADPVIIPDRLRSTYTEAVVRLPHCYQANDNRRPIADEVPDRASQGLPAVGRVLCSFNNNYKITPPVFDIWMRILKRFPDCVLWLLQDNNAAAENLKKAAQDRGVDPARLVFAPRLRNDAHLARHALADVFIDTFPCNAHTTASDALWAGLPVITCAGETFASRVAASLLKAMSMDDCVAEDLAGYEQRIVAALEQPQALVQLRQRVRQARTSSPLFDTPATARHLESAYRQMMERYWTKQLPEDFDVQK